MEIHPSLWTMLIAKALHKDLHSLALVDHVISATIVFSLVLIVGLMVRSSISLVPGKMQQFLEVIIIGLNNLIADVIGPEGKRYLPLIGGLAFFIFISNFLGMVPSMSAPTGNFNTTVACAIVVFLYYNYLGFKEHGMSYGKHFLGPIWWLAPLMLIIEIIGHLARPLSLSMRLFGNISGEHVATGVFYDIFSFILPLPMMALGLFAAFLQSFIFIMLTMVYISGSISHEH